MIVFPFSLNLSLVVEGLKCGQSDIDEVSPTVNKNNND